MLKKLKKTLTLSKSYSKKIDTFDIAKLEKVKDEMIDEMEEPVGWHTMGLPLVASCFLAIFSFVIPQTSLWQGIYTLMGWPKYALMIGIMVAAFFLCFPCCPVIVIYLERQLCFFKISSTCPCDNNFILFVLCLLLFLFMADRLRRACVTVWTFISGTVCCLSFLEVSGY
ncbi:hypothetical protein [Pantoea ananatis]|nr:hypothetical protein [Pantoea ananatis]